jgi:hypothetical protein
MAIIHSSLFSLMLELARMDEFGEVKVKNHPGFFFLSNARYGELMRK